MKKLLIVSIFIAIGIFSQAYLVMAEDGQDTTAIKKTINNFYEAISKGDANSAFAYITDDSYVYNPDKDSNSSLKNSLERLLNNTYIEYTDISYDVSLSNLTINKENTEASIDAQIKFKGFNNLVAEEKERVRERSFILIKKAGSWKIKYME
ncbi:MAG: nuclear transport factor 2 family protein [Candidatus Omnitrophota bacterium]